MFLFKLTLPVLGTVTFGAVGTGIYYGVESWKNISAKTTQVSPIGNGKGDETGEEVPKKSSPPKESASADKEPNSEDSVSQEEPSKIQTSLEPSSAEANQSDQATLITVGLETLK